MKLTISNIAWTKEDTNRVYDFLRKNNIDAIEIAPSIFKENPYDNINEIKEMIEEINFKVPSMQSILFKRTENIFYSDEEMEETLKYLYKGIDFASAINCYNLVFGSPRNRNVNNEEEYNRSIIFFKKLNEYLSKKDVYLALEANPTIYNTNFLNTTKDVVEYLNKINCNHIKLNLDLGTIITNNEGLDNIKNYMDKISHVHISEPYLEIIKKRDIHKELLKILKENNYDKYVSIEMKTVENVEDIFDVILYLKELINEV
ncbi:MAG: sugar phosphate isomerase/epimerase family protein [Erysipelotrichaceae bacterium]|jgi:sugar phosphate isomerase/epimerase